MAMTARELALWWCQDIVNEETPDLKKLQDVEKDLCALRDQGISSDEFKKIWNQNKNSLSLIESGPLAPWAKKNDSPNLLSEDIYSHPKLMTQAPPLVSWIDDDGVVHHKEYDFTSERLGSFTVDDLMNYYYESFPQVRRVRARDIGALKYLLNIYGVDKLLFIIDASTLFIHEEDKRPPKTPLILIDYEDEGIRAYEESLNYR